MKKDSLPDVRLEIQKENLDIYSAVIETNGKYQIQTVATYPVKIELPHETIHLKIDSDKETVLITIKNTP